jgi:hypothetical protein
MILDQCKWPVLVSKKDILPSLKTYADTLLFYYLGELSLKNSQGSLLEIGVGGSTYVLSELANSNNRDFYIIDFDPERLHYYTFEKVFFPTVKTHKLCIDSNEIRNSNINNLSYIHLDGDKDYSSVMNDLTFAIENLVPMGIICQDDYGNNKWPTITIGVLNSLDKLSILFIGDSSIWLVRKEDHQLWLSILKNDDEFNVLAKYLNISNSTKSLNHNTEYLFMNFFKNNYSNIDRISKEQYRYYKKIHNNRKGYLQMPYKIQSEIGRSIFNFKSWIDNLL